MALGEHFHLSIGFPLIRDYLDQLDNREADHMQSTAEDI